MQRSAKSYMTNPPLMSAVSPSIIQSAMGYPGLHALLTTSGCSILIGDAAE
jgi:hypothetical protein